MEKMVFISWVNYHKRSDLIAQHLGAKSFFVYSGRQGKFIEAPFRYIIQGSRTWRILLQERPTVVLVLVPPIFCALIVYLYCYLYGARFVMDSHSASFVSSRWRWALGVHRYLSRKALTTIVANEDIAKILTSWGCRYTRIGFIPGNYPAGDNYPVDGSFNVAVISSFDPDEPLHEIIAAGRQLPGVNFYITGNSKRASSSILNNKPVNCHFTGYLADGDYVSLLRKANAVLDLTNWDHTLLMGAFEAVSLGTPLIISDWPVLRDYFSAGTIHIANTVEGICEGVSRVQREQVELRRGMLHLEEKLMNDWEIQFKDLQNLISTNKVVN